MIDRNRRDRPFRNRSFLGRRSIGGPVPRFGDRPAPSMGEIHGPDPNERLWIDTGSGAGYEVPARNLRHFTVPARNRRRFTVPAFPTGTLSGAIPNSIPPAVETDALRMLLALHVPGTNGTCACGDPLGEETGHCRIGRAALIRLRLKARDEDQCDET